MDIITTRRTKVEKGYELLADITVGTATTSVDITGLNIGKGDEVVLVSYVTSGVGAGTLYLLVNSNYTLTQYYIQSLYAGGTTVAAYRENNSRIGKTTVTHCFLNSKIKLTNSGYCVFQSSQIENTASPSSLVLAENYVTTTFTTSLITSLRLNTSVTNGIGIGSRFQLYKIGGA